MADETQPPRPLLRRERFRLRLLTIAVVARKAPQYLPHVAVVPLDFMQQQNRPRNAQDVSDHFKGALSKSQAEKHLEALSEAGSVRMKLNGKAKVFWYNQELVPELSAAEKAKLASDLAAAKAQVARGADELAQLQKSLKAGRARRSLDELTAEALTLRMEVQNEEAALAKRNQAPRRRSKILPPEDSLEALLRAKRNGGLLDAERKAKLYADIRRDEAAPLGATCVSKSYAAAAGVTSRATAAVGPPAARVAQVLLLSDPSETDPVSLKP